MNLIVRILVVLLALLLVAFATVLLITPLTVANFIEQLDNVSPIARVAAVIILYLIAIGLITLRFRSRPRTDGDMLYVRAAGAQAALTVGSVRDRILKAVGQVPGVASVEATLKSMGGRADVELTVVTTDDKVNIPEKQREIYRTLEQVIKKQLGVEMATRPRVNIELGRSVPPASSTQYSAVPSTPITVTAPPPAAPMVTPAAVPVDAPPALPSTSATISQTTSDATPNTKYGVSTDASSIRNTSAAPASAFDEDETYVTGLDAGAAYDVDDEPLTSSDGDEEDWPPKYTEPL